MVLPTRRTGNDIESILGSFNFVRGHIPNYGVVAGPLYQFIKLKNKDLVDNKEWVEHGEPLFQRLKNLVQSPLVLKSFHQIRPLHLKTDANETGYGGYLYHVNDDGGED
eukprot:Awhi_evm2s3895